VALVLGLPGCCCGLLSAVAVLIAIGGLITSFFGQGHLKIIGIVLNAVAILFALISLAVGIMMMVFSGMEQM
jgi:hypothetical protein